MALSGRCRNHPERDGVGICMRCQKVVCSECSTKIDGINHCRECLEALRAQDRPAQRALSAGPLRALALSALLLLTLLVIVLLVVWRGGAL
jgi:hypothetical protein